jgi:signal transduction histidine kinase
VVNGRATVLEDHIDEAGVEHLVAIRDRGRRLAALVDGVRTLTSSLSGETSLGAVDLGSVVITEVEGARRVYDELTVTVDVPGVDVRGDDALGAVFEHLLRNAVEHNDVGDPTVDVTGEVVGTRAAVRVADDGPGIPLDERAALFERGKHGESGLGLYVVHALARRYGGSVEVTESDAGGPADSLPLAR